MIHHHDEVNKVQLQTYFITFMIFSNIKRQGDMIIIYSSFSIDKLIWKYETTYNIIKVKNDFCFMDKIIIFIESLSN